MSGSRQSVPIGTLLDEAFDEWGGPGLDQEDLKFYDDPASRQGDLAVGLSSVASSRRRRRTTRTDDPEVLDLIDEEPPGWAEP